MSDSYDNWDWVIPPEEGNTSNYQGEDLSNNICIGERVSKLRAAAGLSPQDVEDYTGIKKSELLALEAGLLKMNASMAESLALVLGVDKSELAS